MKRGYRCYETKAKIGGSKSLAHTRSIQTAAKLFLFVSSEMSDISEVTSLDPQLHIRSPETCP
jgi:hypothetical protein